MNGTVFRNANGLPDPGQFTTAHDMAMLGIALQGAFPAILRLFLAALLPLRPPAHQRPQPSARPHQGRRRHQDRLHPRLRLQSRLVGCRRQPPPRRRRHGRHFGRQPRQPDGGADQHLHAEGLDPRRRRPGRQGRRRQPDQGAWPRCSCPSRTRRRPDDKPVAVPAPTTRPLPMTIRRCAGRWRRRVAEAEDPSWLSRPRR